MKAPIVQVLFKGRMLKSVPFEGETLRIGRMRENDIVINNLSVSRFHAELHRRGDGYLIEDCGSENGCFVNGARVERAEVQTGDEILIGKHQIMLRDPEGGDEEASELPPVAPRGASDPWDGAKTYMMGPETVSKLLGNAAPLAGVETNAPDRGAIARDSEAGVPASDATPAPVAAPDVALADSDPESVSEPASASDPDCDADTGSSGNTAPDLVVAADSSPQTPLGVTLADEAQDAAPDESPPTLHAGFVVQADGKLDRILRWEKDRLTVGRSSECDIVLADPEVSRRHALFHREADRFEVRDLDSINGIYVNGERVKRHTLAVGDIIRLESFELTFLLERTPIGDEVKTSALPTPTTEPDAGELTMLGEHSPLSEAGMTPAPLPRHPVTRPEVSAPSTGSAVAGSDGAATDRAGAPGADAEEVVLELCLAAADLPPALREALRAEGGSLTIPARIRLRSDG